jgi:hypothetical protein
MSKRTKFSLFGSNAIMGPLISKKLPCFFDRGVKVLATGSYLKYILYVMT